MLKRLSILTLMGVSLICAKTYTFSVPNSTQAGTAQLKAGQYSLKVDGSQVVLMDERGHRIDTNAKIETTGQKAAATAVSISTANGASRIEWIELGGSNSRVVFQ
jgi:hypothetical protein